MLKPDYTNFRGDILFTAITSNLDGCSGNDVDEVREILGMLGGLVDNIGVCKAVPDVVRVCRPKEAVACAADLSLSVMDNYDHNHVVCS